MRAQICRVLAFHLHILSVHGRSVAASQSRRLEHETMRQPDLGRCHPKRLADRPRHNFCRWSPGCVCCAVRMIDLAMQNGHWRARTMGPKKLGGSLCFSMSPLGGRGRSYFFCLSPYVPGERHAVRRRSPTSASLFGFHYDRTVDDRIAQGRLGPTLKLHIAIIPTRLSSSNGPEICQLAALRIGCDDRGKETLTRTRNIWHYGATVTAGARIEGIKTLARSPRCRPQFPNRPEKILKPPSNSPGDRPRRPSLTCVSMGSGGMSRLTGRPARAAASRASLP